jgi:hypothetical protein
MFITSKLMSMRLSPLKLHKPVGDMPCLKLLKVQVEEVHKIIYEMILEMSTVLVHLNWEFEACI